MKKYFVLFYVEDKLLENDVIKYSELKNVKTTLKDLKI